MVILRLTMQQTISVKELRTNFAKVRKALAKGQTLTLIYRSKPIGKIKPYVDSQEGLHRLLNAPKSLFFVSDKSAVDLVREDRDE